MGIIVPKLIQPTRPINILGSIPPYVAAPSGDTGAEDDFNRAQSYLAGATMSDGVNTWAQMTGGNVTVVDQSIRTAGGGVYCDSVGPTADMDVEFTLVYDDGYNDKGYVAVRASDDWDDAYAVMLYRNKAYLRKRVSGTESSLTATTVAVAVDDVISCRAVGTSISCYINDALAIGPITDSSIASGYAAFYGDSNKYWWDDFVLTLL